MEFTPCRGRFSEKNKFEYLEFLFVYFIIEKTIPNPLPPHKERGKSF